MNRVARIEREISGITKRVTAHTFRHSHATALHNNGVNLRTIQKQLGHSHLETTEIYLHATADGGPMSPLDAPNVVPFHDLENVIPARAQ